MKHRRKDDEAQLPLFADPGKELLKGLIGVDVEAMTPTQAIELLREWKEKYGT